MTIVFAVVGLLFGAMLGEWAGALAGAALGVAIGSHIRFSRRLEELESEVARLPRFPPSRASETEASARESLYDRAPPAWQPLPQAELPAPEPALSSPPPEPPQPIFTEQAAAAEPPARVERESSPSQIDTVIDWVRDYFTGGNVVVRTGIIVLFFGVAFLLKFAADRNLMPIELRLAGVALGGAALLIIGWRLRERLRNYALALQGGGVGLLYLTAFAALRLYDLLPPTLTFAMLVAVAALSAFLAIGQNSAALILLGVTGGFLAPVLASTGQGNHVVLFSYYALLNAGILAIAWFKAWRHLNLLAFVFTYGIGTAWGVLRYQPEHFATTEPFVILFFVMFVAIAVLFALRTAPKLSDYVDGTLVFGTPVMTMALQSALVHDRPYAMAFSALVLSAVYLALAAGAWHRRREQLRMLAEAFLALGVAFLTLAVPLALDGHWTAATWALEGAAILWFGVKQDRKLAFFSGLLLQVGAAVSWLARYDVSVSELPVVNSRCLGAVFIALGGLATARILRTRRERLPAELRWLVTVPVYWGLTWWFVAALGDFDHFLSNRDYWPATLGFATLTALACAALSRWNDWREMEPPTLLLLPVMCVAAAQAVSRGHVLDGSGLVAWPLAIAAWIWLLRWRERHARLPIEEGVHVATLWFLVWVTSLELWWQVRQLRIGDDSWQGVMAVLPAVGALAWILVAARRSWWPAGAFPVAYAVIGAAGLAAYVWAWSIFANAYDGGARPLPYIPFVNPVELAQALALGTLATWLISLRTAPASWRVTEVVRATWAAFCAAAFAFVTALLLRLLHHSTGVSYSVEALARSTTVQAALSIFWGFIALAAMVVGARQRSRTTWFAGAVLLGVVLLKMFLVDLSRTGTIARIVSFIGVGVLMLIIGRFSPVPPADEESSGSPRGARAQEAG